MIRLALVGILFLEASRCFGFVGHLVIEPQVEIENVYHSVKADIYIDHIGYPLSQARAFPGMEGIQVLLKEGRSLMPLEIPPLISRRLALYLSLYENRPEIEDDDFFLKFVTSTFPLAFSAVPETNFYQGVKINPGEILRMGSGSSTKIKSHFALYLGQDWYLTKSRDTKNFTGLLVTKRDRIQSAFLLEKAFIWRTPASQPVNRLDLTL